MIRSTVSRRLRRGCATLVLGWLAASGPGLAGEPFVPASDAEVLERLPARSVMGRRPADPGAESPAATPTERFARVRALLQRARAESDPRYLGQAERLLEPLATQSSPPAEALLLRGSLRQSRHDFAGALADLDAAIRIEPRSAQAWLTKATVHTVRGDYPAARAACLRLARLADPLTSVTAGAQVASLTGDAAGARALLAATLARSTNAPAPIRAWAATLLGEIADRMGRGDDAVAGFRAALALDPDDAYALGALADVLLADGRPAEVVELLRDRGASDGLRLRLAEAQRATGDGAGAARNVVRLRERFAVARERGEQTHRREEARFHLGLLGDAAGAVALARENWEVQREPADLRLLLASALAAGDAATAAEARRWIAENRYEDVRIESPVASARR